MNSSNFNKQFYLPSERSYLCSHFTGSGVGEPIQPTLSASLLVRVYRFICFRPFSILTSATTFDLVRSAGVVTPFFFVLQFIFYLSAFPRHYFHRRTMERTDVGHNRCKLLRAFCRC